MMLVLIPAAGASSRMRGRDKLLEPVDGRPLLARQVAMARAAEVGEVLVTLPPDAEDRRAAIEKVDGDAVDIAEVPDAAEGLSASIRTGVDHAYAKGAHALMVVLADMPEVVADDLRRLASAFDGARVVRATDSTGTAGHPVIFPARLFPALGALRGDQGARALLEAEDVVPVALRGRRATTDLDTPEDWAAWRAENSDR